MDRCRCRLFNRLTKVLLITSLSLYCLYLNPLQKIPSANPEATEIYFSNASNSAATKKNRYCPMPPPNLKGFLNINLEAPLPSLERITNIHTDLELGGHYKPLGCNSKDKVAIIVPYRDREEHLRIFLYNIHPMLKRQMLEYSIFVIEQSDGEPFNRGMLLNVGFVEGLKRENYDCFIFHDVDHIPENDRNLYNCPTQPRHMGVAVEKFHYKLKYIMMFGGVSALRTEHFKLVNGFSNVYWGWGAEDDDMACRIAYHGLNISRPSADVARYKTPKHKQREGSSKNEKLLLKCKERFNVDGLSNLNYTVERIILDKLFTFVRVTLIRVGGG